MKQLIKYSFITLFMSFTLCAIQAQDTTGFLSQHPRVQIFDYQIGALRQQKLALDYFPDPQFSVGYFFSPIETRVGPQRLKLGYMQMLPRWKQLDAMAESMDKQSEALSLEQQEEMLELLRDTRIILFNEAELEEIADLIRKKISILEELHAIVLTRIAVGNALQSDALQIEIKIEELENKLRDILDQERKLLADRQYLSDLEIPPETGAIPALKKDTSFSSHPLIRASDLRTEALGSRGEAALRNKRIRLGFMVDYMIISPRPEMTFDDNGKNALMAGINITLPVFNKNVDAEAAVFDEQTQAEQLRRENQIRKFRQETEKLEITIDEAEREIRLMQELIQKTEQALNVLRTAYAVDQKGIYEILQLELDLLDYRIRKVKSKYKILTAQARLAYYYGGQ